MCGLFGMFLLNGANPRDEHAKVLKNLVLQSEKRGKDATGLSFVKEDKSLLLKHNVTPKKFLDLENVDEFINEGFDSSSGKTYSVIGHSRIKTQGSCLDPNNNHPIKCGDIIGIHDGIIQNDVDIFDSMKELKRAASVDSEVIFEMIRHYSDRMKRNYRNTPKQNHKALNYFRSPVVSAIRQSARTLLGTMACAVQDISNPKAAWLFRTTNPLSIKVFNKEKTIIFASTSEMIENSIKDSCFVNPVDFKMDLSAGAVFNLEECTYKIFSVGK